MAPLCRAPPFVSVTGNDSHKPYGRLPVLGDSLFTFPRAQATGDVCELAQVVGTGPYRIPRWYFNTNTRRCELYYYSGCCGNGNNFPSREACQVLCEVSRGRPRRGRGAEDAGDPVFVLDQSFRSYQPRHAARTAASSGELPEEWLQPTFAAKDTISSERLTSSRRTFSTTKWLEPTIQTDQGDAPRLMAPAKPAVSKIPASKIQSSENSSAGVESAKRRVRKLFRKRIRNRSKAAILMGMPKTLHAKLDTSKPRGKIPRARRPSMERKLGLRSRLLPRPVRLAELVAKAQADVRSSKRLLRDSDWVPLGDPGPFVTRDLDRSRPFGLQDLDESSSAGAWDYSDGFDSQPFGLNVQPQSFAGLEDRNFDVSRLSGSLEEDSLDEDRQWRELFGPGAQPRSFEVGSEVLSPEVQRVVLGPPPPPRPGSFSVPTLFVDQDTEVASSQGLSVVETAPEVDVGLEKDAVCGEPMSPGSGQLSMPRWWFNASAEVCQFFVYSGEGGNANNFPTCTLCQSLCEVDPCTQERDPGIGSLQISRHFFNKNTKLCEPYTYFGSGGNRNNFPTVQDCRSRCPESPNPCSFGEPMRSGNGGMMQCGFSLVVTNTCPANYYCHVGSSVATTVCCPKGNGERCGQAMSVGIGTSSLPRWSFDDVAQACREFAYRGLQGNENNFLSQADCDNACFVNPCASGAPYRSGGQVVQCSARNQAVCPSSYYCHLGAEARSTLCCPLAGPRCWSPLAQGVGPALLRRWHFHAPSRSCREFPYFGLGGSPNNFLSQAECAQACPVFRNPCRQGSPCVDSAGLEGLVRCSRHNASCPRSFFCHHGREGETDVCCPTQGRACEAAEAVGSGGERLERWRFDPAADDCVPFLYSGHGGNANNFLHLRACRARCGVEGDVCASGRGSGGCERDADCGRGEWCHRGASAATSLCCRGAVTAPCLLGESAGVGRELLLRWRFDPTAGHCVQFTYNGRGGNQNNFSSRLACLSRCPARPNPCPAGQPVSGPSGPVSCADGQRCPSGSWCHLGADAATSLCCPATSRLPVCGHPLDTGSGSAQLGRWHFDSGRGECRAFVFRGLHGNPNNFPSHQACREACLAHGLKHSLDPKILETSSGQRGSAEADSASPAPPDGSTANQAHAVDLGKPPGPKWPESRGGPFVNPCLGQPERSSDGRTPRLCRHSGDCRRDFFCHAGVREDGGDRVCCPESGETCVLGLAEGSGGGLHNRYYFERRTGQCLAFTYRGRHGNSNNFPSRRHCVAACGDKRRWPGERPLHSHLHASSPRPTRRCSQTKLWRPRETRPRWRDFARLQC